MPEKKSEVLHTEIVTQSKVPLYRSGVYRHAQSEETRLMMLSYAWGDGPVQQVDAYHDEPIPDDVIEGLLSPDVRKISSNAELVRVCLGKLLKLDFPAKQWYCMSIWHSYVGLPESLDAAGDILGIQTPKPKEGASLIHFFCTPNAQGQFNSPDDYPEKWAACKDYNNWCVEAEREIWHKLQRFPLPPSEWLYYRMDQYINQYGIKIDRLLVDQAIHLLKEETARLRSEFQFLTGLTNPNSNKSVLNWLKKEGILVKKLDKQTIASLISRTEGTVQQALQILQQLSKTSIAKYYAIEAAANDDDRLRGMFRFYGTHTGRWSGRLVQLQNLPRNLLKDLKAARDSIRNGENPEIILTLYGPPIDVCSQLLRSVFIPSEGCILYVADYSAIEARVLAWLAKEPWRLKAFADGEDIYCSSASQMFKVPVVKGGTNSALRQKGKIAELALGYGGSVGALINMGALQQGLKEDELPDLVKRWREANPHIVAFWKQVGQAVEQAVRQEGTVSLGRLVIRCTEGILTIRLPSGRDLFYREPALESSPNGLNLVYSGVDKSRRYTRIRTYGARIVENIAQAIARDILAGAMVRLEKAKYSIVLHCHDEVVIDAPEAEGRLEDICRIMEQTPPWAEGLQLRADGYTCPFYQKM